MKKRIDILLSEKLKITRAKSQAMIMAGEISINNKLITKSGQEFPEDIEIIVKDKFPYVSRGASKIEKAINEFKIVVKDKIICDIGASTGGFTDYVLQNGAQKVYAIDSGYGQLDAKLRNDSRVVNMERTNIRDINFLPEKIDIFVIDVSFISLKKVLPQIIIITQNNPDCHFDRAKRAEKSVFKLRGRSLDEVCPEPVEWARDDKVEIVALIKPQFEVGKSIADKTKGVIRDEKIRQDVILDISNFSKSLGYKIKGLVESPISGAKGNKEFLIYLT